MELEHTSGSAEVIVIIKAAPQISKRSGETVCCAGIDPYGNWLRLYPVSFRYLNNKRKFGRWDRIKFKWRKPKDDARTESRRVDQESIEIIGSLKKNQRENFLAKSLKTSLDNEYIEGRSLALIRPEIIEFVIKKKTEAEYSEEVLRFEALRLQSDLFTKQVIPHKPCEYSFKYRYRIDDGVRFGTCQDWETERTFIKWMRLYGEAEAISKMQNVFGKEYPEKGMLLAMGTHSLYPDKWLINGVIRLNEAEQGSLL